MVHIFVGLAKSVVILFVVYTIFSKVITVLGSTGAMGPKGPAGGPSGMTGKPRHESVLQVGRLEPQVGRDTIVSYRWIVWNDR